MAPKNKFTKEEIICAALDVVRAGGIGALTAKAIAERFGRGSSVGNPVSRLRNAVHPICEE